VLEQAVVIAGPPVGSEIAKVKVTFVFPICECCPQCVSLTGDFNGWSPNATSMKRCDDGHWETTLELAPGRYEYKFVRDGEWMPDLLARENVLNGYGTLNSVIEVEDS
jgi:1,4-alpha-glucan branching enzyme